MSKSQIRYFKQMLNIFEHFSQKQIDIYFDSRLILQKK